MTGMRFNIDPWRPWKIAAIVVVMIAVGVWLASCAAPNPGPCPPVPEYSDEFTAEFRAQLKTIPEGSPIAIYILDANKLRKEVRACQ